MPVSIPRSFIERILLGSPEDRRQLQDSPILGDVWIKFGEQPDQPHDLLITPHRAVTAGAVAEMLYKRIAEDKVEASIALLEGLVVARLTFEQVLRCIVPSTKWWHDQGGKSAIADYFDGETWWDRPISALLRAAQYPKQPLRIGGEKRFSAVDRYVALAGLILWAEKAKGPEKKPRNDAEVEDCFNEAVKQAKAKAIGKLLQTLFDEIKKLDVSKKQEKPKPLVFQVSLNRAALPAISKSVLAVKGDAAATLFAINCSDINWAIIDSGIDDTHQALQDDNQTDPEQKSRVIKSLDFSILRRVVSVDNRDPKFRKATLKQLEDVLGKEPDNANKLLQELADNAFVDLPTDWGRIERLIELPKGRTPTNDHGTHVAGILGAKRVRHGDAEKSATLAKSKKTKADVVKESPDAATGMCPDIKLYDLRVLAGDTKETEFAIIAALQYIRYLNAKHRHITIHGANLSLSIPHDVRNYACGRTPICMECERLVEGGVVVVAAAGNFGYQSFETKSGAYEGYVATSVTDPGNAESVITVGATHRYSPHSYGVSYFSSRGPTGDGRLKPDLVAPGERIRGPVPGDGTWDDMDGTSMAAPHVSGAAAMLMARYPELIGEPRRIKRILCETATDLGRERSFQGHGMLDVLRALQSI